MTTSSKHCTRSRSWSGNPAFTLIELLVVIAIMAILAALSLLAMRGVNSKAAIDKTRVEVAAIANALEQYKSVNDGYPAELTAEKGNANSIGSFLGSSKLNISGAGELIDPFGKPYNYVKPGTKNPASFDLESEGPTSKQEDNIGNW